MMKTLLHAISASILPDRLRNSKHISYKHTVSERPFSSTQALNLQKHKLTHSDKKPYSCDQCNISFRQAR